MIAHARDARIDMLRGVSILLVLLHHFNIPYSLKDTGLAALLGWPFLHALARNGNYGVTMFFVVSGFLITRNALDRWGGLDRIRPGAFYTLRAARILPCLLLALLTVDALALAGVQIFGNRADAAVSLWTVNAAALTAWVNVLIVQHGWINYPLGVLWSLSVEMAFYLLFPLACLALRRAGAGRAGGWAHRRGPLYRLASQGEAGAYLYGYAACFDAIAMGCCAAVLARRGRFAVLGRPAVRAIIGAAMAGLYLAWPIGQSNVLGTTAMAFGTALLLLGGATASRAHARPLRALAACGRLSYEIYLFHLVVLGLIRGWRRRRWRRATRGSRCWRSIWRRPARPAGWWRGGGRSRPTPRCVCTLGRELGAGVAAVDLQAAGQPARPVVQGAAFFRRDAGAQRQAQRGRLLQAVAGDGADRQPAGGMVGRRPLHAQAGVGQCRGQIDPGSRATQSITLPICQMPVSRQARDTPSRPPSIMAKTTRASRAASARAHSCARSGSCWLPQKPVSGSRPLARRTPSAYAARPFRPGRTRSPDR